MALTCFVLATLGTAYPTGGQRDPSVNRPTSEGPRHPYSPVHVELDQADTGSIPFDINKPAAGPSQIAAPGAIPFELSQQLQHGSWKSVATSHGAGSSFAPRKPYARPGRKDLVERIEPSELRKLPWSFPPVKKRKERAVNTRSELPDVQKRINEQIFGGKLKFVNTKGLPVRSWATITTGFLEVSRVLPMTDFPPTEFELNHGIIKEVRIVSFRPLVVLMGWGPGKTRICTRCIKRLGWSCSRLSSPSTEATELMKTTCLGEFLIFGAEGENSLKIM